MKYFKLDFEDTISIWKLREDGMERCVYDNSIEQNYMGQFGQWHNPDVFGVEPITVITYATEISEEDAVLESI